MEMALLITQKAFNLFKGKLKEKRVDIRMTKACKNWLADKGLKSQFGAREIYRLIQEKIKPFFVDAVLFGELSDGGKTKVDVKDNEIVISIDK